jgi:hypothetical protein
MEPLVLLRTLSISACVLALVGCTDSNNGKDAVPAATVKASATPLAPRKDKAPVFASDVADAAPMRVSIVQLDVFRPILPLGAISRSEEFWKHVDEQRIDVGTYDLLRKNGWRLGVAPTAEWPYFRDILNSYPSASETTIVTGPGVLEVPMKKNIPYQVMSYFDDQNKLFFRTDERCENLLSITFKQAPRRPGEARVTVCPTVRSLYTKFQVKKNNEEVEIRSVRPERLYELNLQVDIPINHFLVIAPSPEVKWKTSLGATFLVHDWPAEQMEQVILLAPRELEQLPPKPARTPAQ